ncbi:hypothetical protein GCM10009087_15760 [Sphingomonas oligophenolica]|uniref:Uncharacterized protein n=1 Tax=Sphingomonas oligophenolica TaxID=301154 RepID=A0ABU9Y7Z6_9SPHN
MKARGACPRDHIGGRVNRDELALADWIAVAVRFQHLAMIMYQSAQPRPAELEQTCRVGRHKPANVVQAIDHRARDGCVATLPKHAADNLARHVSDVGQQLRSACASRKQRRTGHEKDAKREAEHGNSFIIGLSWE